MEHLTHKSIWWPDTVRLGGLRLRPATLGHLRLLEATGSAYIGGGITTAADAGLTLLLLRLPWRLGRRLLAHPRLCSLAACAAALRCSPAVTVALGQWLAAEMWTPERFTAPGTTSDCAAFPSVTGRATRLAMLCHRSGPSVTPFPRRSPWDYTVREALLLAVAQDEARGGEYLSRAEAAAAAAQETPDHA